MPFAISELLQFSTQVFDFLVKIATLAAPLLLAYLAYRSQLAAKEVKEVKATLEASTTHTDAKLDKVFHVVNGAMTEQLRLNMQQARRIVAMGGGAVEVAAADAAEKLYRDHVAGQTATGAT